AVVWMLFLPRRFRIICFWIVTPFEIGIILTANYTFLNYLVLVLGFLLLDDRFVEWILPQKIRGMFGPAMRTSPALNANENNDNWRKNWRKRLAPLRISIAGA